jgi:hypothetical protein
VPGPGWRRIALPASRAVSSADGTFGPVTPDQRHITAVTAPAITLANMSKTTKVMGKRASA